jgi:hypothetical protein
MAFGCVGAGAWMYGKRRASAPHMVLGAILIGYSYFISDPVILYGIGIALTLALFAVKAT